MAYVIGQACIGTKDTACIGVCPTDSIHGYKESEQLFIDPATCIDCDACAQACPVDAIFPGDQVPADQQKFIAINAKFYDNWDREKSIAVTSKPASESSPETDQTAEGSDLSKDQDATWREVENWQELWSIHKNEIDDPAEIQKRYGRVRSVFETPDKYIIRFFLPEVTPNHPFIYRYDLPKTISSYNVKASIKSDHVVKISGQMTHPKLKKLCGLVNSFPDRFYVELPMDAAIDNVNIQNKSEHVVDVVLTKKAA